MTCTATHTEVGTVKRSARKQADSCVPQRIGALLYFPGGLTASARELAQLLCIPTDRGEVAGARIPGGQSIAETEMPYRTVSNASGKHRLIKT